MRTRCPGLGVLLMLAVTAAVLSGCCTVSGAPATTGPLQAPWGTETQVEQTYLEQLQRYQQDPSPSNKAFYHFAADDVVNYYLATDEQQHPQHDIPNRIAYLTNFKRTNTDSDNIIDRKLIELRKTDQFVTDTIQALKVDADEINATKLKKLAAIQPYSRYYGMSFDFGAYERKIQAYLQILRTLHDYDAVFLLGSLARASYPQNPTFIELDQNYPLHRRAKENDVHSQFQLARYHMTADPTEALRWAFLASRSESREHTDLLEKISSGLSQEQVTEALKGLPKEDKTVKQLCLAIEAKNSKIATALVTKDPGLRTEQWNNAFPLEYAVKKQLPGSTVRLLIDKNKFSGNAKLYNLVRLNDTELVKAFRQEFKDYDTNLSLYTAASKYKGDRESALGRAFSGIAKVKDYQELAAASESFAKELDTLKQAEHYERVGELVKAIALYEELTELDKVRGLAITVAQRMEKKGDLLAAEHYYQKAGREEDAARVGKLAQDSTGGAINATALAEKCKPSMVTVHSTFSQGTGQGSGFFISKDGHLLTNRHVIEATGGNERASQIEVQTVTMGARQGKRYRAKLLYVFDFDMALLQVTDGQSEPFAPLKLADSELVRVGAPVLAIGSGMGLEASISVGNIKGIRSPSEFTKLFADASCQSTTPEATNQCRQQVSQEWLTVYFNNYKFSLFETDAVINHGNSGGPLLNNLGEVIGINSLGVDQQILRHRGRVVASQPVQGMFFALQINAAREVLRQHKIY